MNTISMKRLVLFCLLGLSLLASAGMNPARVAAAPLLQSGCSLPATVTTADELSDCIAAANAGSGGTITLGADIDLTTLTSPLPQITSEITLEGAGYAIDGGNSVRVFFVGATGSLTINQATLQNGSFDSGGGGAIANVGTLTVTNSTLTGNYAGYGGAMVNGGTVTVANSTFSGNSARAEGGAIDNFGTVTVTNSTFSGNSAPIGGGIYNDDGNQLHMAGNIFAKGTSGDNCVNAGTLNDNGYNLSDDATCTDGGTGSVTNATLNLGALADNGGPTLTHLPGAGSDAIGAIPNGTTISNNGTSWTCNDVDTFTDQRGEARPINSGDDCTVGAVEVTICPSWTVTTADQLYDCITLANANESPSPTTDTITLGADIDLTALTSSPLPQINSTIVVEGAGYAIDGGWDGVSGSSNGIRIFYVASAGDFTVNQATLQNGSATGGGGAVANALGTVTVSNSTLSGNSATYGGAIVNGGTLRVASSTFSGNSATSSENSGAISMQDGTLTLTNSTFFGNSRGGIFYTAGTQLHLAGNIFAVGQSGQNCVNDDGGTLTDNGYNLSDDTTCTNGGTGSATNATLNLGPLADNGGLTLTHLPADPSDAIGAIPNGTTISNNGTSWTCNQTFTDQRGESRPINSGDDCTAGAVEVAPPFVCVLPATVTTADQLYDCIAAANAGSGGTITLGADIDLTTLTTSPLPQISSTITLEGAGYAIDGGGIVQIFDVGATAGATGNLTVNQATLQNGSADSGGAIHNQGVVTVTGSTFSDNEATGASGGGIFNGGGTVTVSSSTFSGNSARLGGGGIHAAGGAVTVSNSTLSGNAAFFAGGGIFNEGGTLAVTNSTVSGNTADAAGGGISHTGSGIITVSNSTFFGNEVTRGGATFLASLDSTANLAANIFADSVNGDNCDIRGTFNDNGYNLSDDTTCTDGGTGSATNAALNLGPLADNGGPTQTHLPNNPSDAIGAIANGTTINNNGVTLTCDQSTTDQRGELRPINSGDDCTAGAVEVAGAGRLTIAKETDPAGGTNFPFTIDPGTYSFDFKWGRFGNGDGEFQFPRGVAVDDAGNVYVADRNNDRIQKFDSSGSYLTQWGGPGSGDGQFDLPSGVAVDFAGNVYVADFNNNRVQKFDSSGTHITQWGTNGSGDGQFSAPLGVAVDAAGNVYVADSGNDRIQKFDSSGVYLTNGAAAAAATVSSIARAAWPSTSLVLSTWPTSITIVSRSSTAAAPISPSGAAAAAATASSAPRSAWPLIPPAASILPIPTTTASRSSKAAAAYLTQWGSTGSGDGQFPEPDRPGR